MFPIGGRHAAKVRLVSAAPGLTVPLASSGSRVVRLTQKGMNDSHRPQNERNELIAQRGAQRGHAASPGWCAVGQGRGLGADTRIMTDSREEPCNRWLFSTVPWGFG